MIRSRRASLIGTAWLLVALLASACTIQAADRPAVTEPRQTSGDTAVQPVWEQHLIVTVGARDADIVGTDQRAIQAAVDHVARLGGGTVRILAGTYRLRNAVYLQSPEFTSSARDPAPS
jgi:polygalacturonase